jgi:enoyl-CoA hydratase
VPSSPAGSALAATGTRPDRKLWGMDEVLVAVDGPVATVTLNRPERRNAISGALLTGLRESLAELSTRPEIRAIVLTGADPAFCAGLDLTELGQSDGAIRRISRGDVFGTLGKPLIGAINGAAITGGLELALACDFLIASERARFADTHARMGIQPGWGLTVELPAAVGLRRAREMSATGNFVGAQTALEWGLVNHVVPHEELLSFCGRLASDIASSDQAALTALFATYSQAAALTGREARRIETENHTAWHAGGIDAAKVAERRTAVIERGRSQS